MILFEELNRLNRISDVLIEGIADVKANYPKIDDSMFDQLIALDPTYNPNRDKLGTYGKWILNLFNKGRLKEEDFYKVPDYLAEFERKKKGMQNKDIGQFKSLGELATTLANTGEVELTQRQKDRQLQKQVRQAIKDADLVFEDSNWEVYIPHTFEADRALSQLRNNRANHWCTAASQRYFDSYTAKGELYVLIRKSDNEHFQFHFETEQYMDNEDSLISLIDLIEDDRELVIFFGNIVQDKASRGDIDILSGFDDIDFDSETMNLYVTENNYQNAINESYSGYRRNEGNVSSDLICALISGEPEVIWDNLLSWNFAEYLPNDLIKYCIGDYKQEIMEECARLGLTLDDLNAIGNGQDYSNETGEPFDIYDEVYDAIAQAHYSGCESGVYNELSNLINYSVITAIKDTGMIVNPPSDLFNYDVRKLQIKNPFYQSSKDDYTYCKVILTDISYKEDDYDYYYSNNPILNEFLSKFSEVFSCKEPYYGFDEFDDESFCERLLDELSYIE